MTDYLIHDNFAKWLLPALPGASGDLIAKRKEGVLQVAGALEDKPVSAVLDLVRLAVGIKPIHAETISEARRPFVDVDPGFSNSGNDYELAILAAASLATLMQGDGSQAQAAALGVLVGDARGHRTVSNFAPFTIEARKHRRRLALHAVPSQSWPRLLSDEEETEPDLAQVSAHVAEIDAFVTDNLPVYREEMNITWWVISEYSRDLDTHFSDIPESIFPLVLGKELGDLTETGIGPIAANAVLAKMLNIRGIGSGSSPLRTGIDAAPAEWKQLVVDSVCAGRTPDGLTPMLAAIHRSHEVAGGPAWVSTFLSLCAMEPSDGWTHKDLAGQMYDECILFGLDANDASVADD
jgi:hypothetical protein